MYYAKNYPEITIAKPKTLLDQEHLHNEYEIIYCIKGSFTAIINSQEYLIKEGEMSVSFPHHSHHYLYNKNEELEVYLLIFDTKQLPEIENILSNAHPLSCRMVPKYRDEIEKLFENIFQNRKNDNFSLLRRSGYLKLISSEIFDNMELVPSKKTDPEILSELINYCIENHTTDIHLSDLEEQLHLTKYYISRILKEKLSLGFNEYIHSLRMDTAKNLLLETDTSISNIAYKVGYNTVRNFNRIFLKTVGMTPRKFRESKAKK